MGYRISVDTGGTFTDVVVADGRGIRAIGKALTTPQRIFDGMRAAIEVAAEECKLSGDALLRKTDMLIYGTTRATNAVVTQSTAKTAFLTTRGFRDILVLKEGGKYDPHDYSYDYPPPYIPRRYTFEIDERIDSQGNVVRPLDQAQAREVVRTLKERKFEAVAVSLLWSIANSTHEQAIARILDAELPGVPFTLSHQLIPIVREYRRASTTAVDASLKPLMQQHLRQMEEDLRAGGFAGELLIGTSAGGCQHVSEVATRPVQMLKSGPAMAPVAGQAYTTIEKLGGDAIVCDTGGTTFDVGLVRDGNLVYTRDSWLGRRWIGHMVAMSTVDVRSIGAGGGSIAWVDAGGLLRVGPHSAGAMPGPACYGRGGDKPTVTDAGVVLGYFDPDYFNGGRMTLDAAAAHRVIEALATAIGRSPRDTAFAIITIANELMIKAIHEITVSEGLNPRESVIVAGGGAAGLNIMPIARELGCSHHDPAEDRERHVGLRHAVFRHRVRADAQPRDHVWQLRPGWRQQGARRDRREARGVPPQPARRRSGAVPQGVFRRGALQVAGVGARHAPAGEAVSRREGRGRHGRGVPHRARPCLRGARRAERSRVRELARQDLDPPDAPAEGGRQARRPPQAQALDDAAGLFRRRELAQDSGIPRALAQARRFHHRAGHHRGADHHHRGLSAHERLRQPVRALHPEIMKRTDVPWQRQRPRPNAKPPPRPAGKGSPAGISIPSL